MPTPLNLSLSYILAGQPKNTPIRGNSSIWALLQRTLTLEHLDIWGWVTLVYSPPANQSTFLATTLRDLPTVRLGHVNWSVPNFETKQ